MVGKACVSEKFSEKCILGALKPLYLKIILLQSSQKYAGTSAFRTTSPVPTGIAPEAKKPNSSFLSAGSHFKRYSSPTTEPEDISFLQ